MRIFCQLLYEHGDYADHFLVGKAHQRGDVIEQLVSRQELMSASRVRASYLLYWDKKKREVKRGAAGQGAGSARRLARVLYQLDVGWFFLDADPMEIIDLLPPEFDEFKSQGVAKPRI